jgi:hypothetical protein
MERGLLVILDALGKVHHMLLQGLDLLLEPPNLSSAAAS